MTAAPAYDQKTAAAGQRAEEFPPANSSAGGTPLSREESRERLKKLADMLHVPAVDPMAREWLALDVEEREFWLKVSRLDRHLAPLKWAELPPEVRDKIKNNLYRAAQRAALILASCKRASS